MRFTTYSRFLPELADAVNLQALLDQLGDFLLQSGFSGGLWNDDSGEPDRGMEALREAILQALMDSGQLTPEMLQVLRGESTGDPERDKDLERQLSEMLDQIVQRLIDEGFLKVDQAPQVPAGYQSLFGPGGQAREAAQQVQFGLTEKGMDFLGYKTLKGLLGSIGKSSFGAHDTRVPRHRRRVRVGQPARTSSATPSTSTCPRRSPTRSRAAGSRCRSSSTIPTSWSTRRSTARRRPPS